MNSDSDITMTSSSEFTSCTNAAIIAPAATTSTNTVNTTATKSTSSTDMDSSSVTVASTTAAVAESTTTSGAALKQEEDSHQQQQQQQHHQQQQEEDVEEQEPIMQTTLTAKYGKQTITIPNLPSHNTTISKVKQLILQQTNILPKRQKFIGLTLQKEPNNNNNSNNGTKRKAVISDETTLDKLQIKKQKDILSKDQHGKITHVHHSFILMGTPESELFIDPDDISNSHHHHHGNDNVVNDFDFDFNMNSEEWKEHFVNKQNLLKFTNSTEVHIMNPPREGKKLMVLDLDHTLLDFSSRKITAAAASGTGTGTGTGLNATTSGAGAGAGAGVNPGMTVQETINQMKRPFMDEFLAAMYVHYDLVVWSQTSWRWLETKLVELGMLTNPNYRFCFVLDKTSMFAITSTKQTGQKIKHYVKPLQIIWSKFPKRWDASNTIHLDDLSRNFALNIENGLKVSAYYRKKKRNSSSNRYISVGSKDVELIGLIGYCAQLAKEVDDFRNVEFKYWKDVVNGTKNLIMKK